MAEVRPAVFVGTGPNYGAIRVLDLNDKLSGVVNHVDFATGSVMVKNASGVVVPITLNSGEVLGNVGSGVTALTSAELSTLISGQFGATLKGQIFVFDGTNMVALDPGTTNQVIGYDGSTATGLKHIDLPAPGTGVDEFINLIDTPADYTASDGYFVRVTLDTGGGLPGLEFVDVPLGTTTNVGNSDLTLQFLGGETERRVNLDGKKISFREETLGGDLLLLDAYPGHRVLDRFSSPGVLYPDNTDDYGRIDLLALYNGNGGQITAGREGIALELFGDGKIYLGDGTSTTYTAAAPGEFLGADALGVMAWINPGIGTLTENTAERSDRAWAANFDFTTELNAGRYQSEYATGTPESLLVPSMPRGAGELRVWAIEIKRTLADGTLGSVIASSSYIDEEGGPFRERIFSATLSRDVLDTEWTVGDWYEVSSELSGTTRADRSIRSVKKGLIIKLGQSNHLIDQDTGDVLDPYSPLDMDLPNVKVFEVSHGTPVAGGGDYVKAPAGQVHLMRNPTADDATGVGTIQSLVKKYISLNPEIEEIYVINRATIGSGFLREDWLSRGPYDPLGGMGADFIAARDELKKFLDVNPDVKPLAIIWQQGEADRNLDATIYRTQLMEMVQDLRAEMPNGSDTPFIVGTMLQAYIDSQDLLGEPIKLIDLAHREVASYIANSDFVDAADLDSTADGIHRGRNDVRTLGRRFAVKMTEMLKADRHLGVPSFRFQAVGETFKDVSDECGHLFNQKLAHDPERGLVLTTETRASVIQVGGPNAGDSVARYDGFGSDIALDPRAYTKACWVKPFFDGQTDAHLMSGAGTGALDGNFFTLGKSGHGDYAALTGPDFPAIPTQEWTHVALTFDGTEFKTYMNGALQATFTDNNDVYADFHSMYVGQLTDDQNTEFKGYIDDVVAFPRALSDSSILTLLLQTYDKLPMDHPMDIRRVSVSGEYLSRKDVSNMVLFENTTNISFNIRRDVDRHIQVGSEITMVLTTGNDVTIQSPNGEVTIESSDGIFAMSGIWSKYTLLKIAEDDWVLVPPGSGGAGGGTNLSLTQLDTPSSNVGGLYTGNLHKQASEIHLDAHLSPVRLFALNTAPDTSTLDLTSVQDDQDWFEVIIPGNSLLSIGGTNYAAETGDAERYLFRGTGIGTVELVLTSPYIRPVVNFMSFVTSASLTAQPVNDRTTGATGFIYHLSNPAVNVTLPDAADMDPIEGHSRCLFSCDWAARDAAASGVTSRWITTDGTPIANPTDFPATGTERVEFLLDPSVPEWIMLAS